MTGSLIGSCVRKVRLPGERQAIAFARKMLKKHCVGQYPYACPFCSGWHVSTEVPLAQRLDALAQKQAPSSKPRKPGAADPVKLQRERARHLRKPGGQA